MIGRYYDWKCAHGADVVRGRLVWAFAGWAHLEPWAPGDSPMIPGRKRNIQPTAFKEVHGEQWTAI